MILSSKIKNASRPATGGPNSPIYSFTSEKRDFSELFGVLIAASGIEHERVYIGHGVQYIFYGRQNAIRFLQHLRSRVEKSPAVNPAPAAVAFLVYSLAYSWGFPSFSSIMTRDRWAEYLKELGHTDVV